MMEHWTYSDTEVQLTGKFLRLVVIGARISDYHKIPPWRWEKAKIHESAWVQIQDRVHDALPLLWLYIGFDHIDIGLLKDSYTRGRG